MNRRHYLTATGTGLFALLAGCARNPTENGERVDETVRGQEKFDVDLSDGERVRIEVENEGSGVANVYFRPPGGAPNQENAVQNDKTLRYTAEQSGAYEIHVRGERAHITVTVSAPDEANNTTA